MKGVVVCTSDLRRVEQVVAASPGSDVRPARSLKELTDALLWDDTETVVLDVENPAVDALDAVRLVKGTRWDVRLVCIGGQEGAARAGRAGVEVLAPDAWMRLADVLA